MFYISEPLSTAPSEYKNELQKLVYATLEKLAMPFERVDCDEAITMQDCILIDEKLDMKTVKTLFLCNRQQTAFYLFITTADKAFSTKDFSSALGVARVSFATEALLQQKLGVKIGAATVFGVLLDAAEEVKVVIDKAVLSESWYGCSDGTTTGYMKVKTENIVHDFLQFAKHEPLIVEI
jgi:Ala-tRNA(Pro) deacylase